MVKFPLASALVYADGYFDWIGSISQAFKLAGLWVAKLFIVEVGGRIRWGLWLTDTSIIV